LFHPAFGTWQGFFILAGADPKMAASGQNKRGKKKERETRRGFQFTGADSFRRRTYLSADDFARFRERLALIKGETELLACLT